MFNSIRKLGSCTSVLIAFVLLMLLFPGCGEKPTMAYTSGSLWVVNNLCPMVFEGIYDERRLKVDWDGEELDIPNNMHWDGTSTGAGAVLLTPEPLPGGTPVNFMFTFQFGFEVRTLELSELLGGKEPLIDGDITIDIYSLMWNPRIGSLNGAASVVAGKSDGIHDYPGM